MKDLFLKFLSQTLNRDVEDLSGVLYKAGSDGTLTEEINENAIEELLRIDAERVKTLKASSEPGRTFDDGHKAGVSEALSKLEKTLRRTYGATDIDAKDAADLVAKIVSKTAAAESDEQKVKSSPAYLALERQMQDALEAKESEFAAKLSDIENAQSRAAMLAKYRSEGEALLHALNPVLPQNPAAAKRQVDTFLSMIDEYEIKNVNGVDVVMKDGKRVENSHGHPILFADLIKESAKDFFDFKKQDDAGNAGNGGSGSQSGGSFVAPINAAEARERFYAASTAEERQALQAYMIEGGK